MFVYQNNINRPTSRRTSPTRPPPTAACTGRTRSSCRTAHPARPPRNDQFFPWAAGRERALLRDLVRPPARPRQRAINTWQARSSNDGPSFASADQHPAWNPNLGFFTSGAFIGDYNGIAASTDAVYPVWTDGRDNAIDQTGIGETDIFTKFQKNP